MHNSNSEPACIRNARSYLKTNEYNKNPFVCSLDLESNKSLKPLDKYNLIDDDLIDIPELDKHLKKFKKLELERASNKKQNLAVDEDDVIEISSEEESSSKQPKPKAASATTAPAQEPQVIDLLSSNSNTNIETDLAQAWVIIEMFCLIRIGIKFRVVNGEILFFLFRCIIIRNDLFSNF